MFSLLPYLHGEFIQRQKMIPSENVSVKFMSDSLKQFRFISLKIKVRQGNRKGRTQ